jgi:hypothetical protein
LLVLIRSEKLLTWVCMIDGLILIYRIWLLGSRLSTNRRSVMLAARRGSLCEMHGRLRFLLLVVERLVRRRRVLRSLSWMVRAGMALLCRVPSTKGRL